jgi:hypothetical protein
MKLPDVEIEFWILLGQEIVGNLSNVIQQIHHIHDGEMDDVMISVNQ